MVSLMKRWIKFINQWLTEGIVFQRSLSTNITSWIWAGTQPEWDSEPRANQVLNLITA